MTVDPIGDEPLPSLEPPTTPKVPARTATTANALVIPRH